MTIAISAKSQEVKKVEAGLRAGYGLRNEKLPEGNEYKPVVILPYVSYYLLRRAEKPFSLSIYSEPQITAVVMDKQSSAAWGMEWELGVNAGVIMNYHKGNFITYAGAGSGPSFISARTSQQAHGFLFSDNFFTGIKRELGNNFCVDVQLRVRHISNAGIKKPNKGIDNVFAVAGISKYIGARSRN